MKAIVYDQYGSYNVLKYKEVEKPTPKDDEVLVKVFATSLNRADEYMMKGTPFLIRMMNGFMKPKNRILGFDLSGVIVEIGEAVKSFKIGDPVFGNTNFGAFAEYARVKESRIVLKPDHVSFHDAAATVQAGTTALQAIQKAKLKAHEKVLVNGASGGVGLFAVQIAKAYEAEVTGICSEKTASVVKASGATQVINYKTENFTSSDMTYDVILGINGYQPLKAYKKALNDNGTYMMVGGSGKQIFEGMVLAGLYSRKKSKRMTGLGESKVTKMDLETLQGLLHDCKIKPHIDQIFSLENTQDAFKYVIEEHPVGKVVIEVKHSEE